MHKIAIIRLHHLNIGGYGDETYGYNTQKIIEHINDFEEVDDATFDMVKQQIGNYHGNYAIIEKIENQDALILKCVADVNAATKRREKAQADYEAKQAEEKAARALKRKAKTDAQEKELLETLLKKHGGSVTPPEVTTVAKKAKTKSK